MYVYYYFESGVTIVAYAPLCKCMGSQLTVKVEGGSRPVIGEQGGILVLGMVALEVFVDV